MDELSNAEGYLEPRFTVPQNRTYVTGDAVVRGIFGVQNTDDFPEVAAFGFNVVQAYGSIDTSLPSGDERENEYLERMLRYLDRAKSNQLQVLHTIPGNYVRNFARNGNNAFINFINEFKNHDGLYAWYIYDEPKPQNPDKPDNPFITVDELQRAYEKIKELDPNHLVFTSTWEEKIPKNYASGYDVMLPQMYFGNGAVGMDNLHFDGYDVPIMNGASKAWLSMINTHDSKLESLNNYLKSIHYTSPKGWDLFVLQQKGEENKQLAKDYIKERLKVLNKNLSDPFAPSAKVEDIPDVIKDQLRLESKNPEELLGGFENSGALPKSGDMLLGDVLSAFCHGSNGIFSWIWQSSSSTDLKKFNYYTIFQYPPVRDAIKRINELIQEIGSYLNQPETDYIHIQGPLIMRFLEKNNRKLLLVVKQGKGEIDKYSLEFPVEWGLSYSDQFLDLYTKKQIRFDNKLLTMENNTGLVLEGPLPKVAPIQTIESTDESVSYEGPLPSGDDVQ